MQIFRRATEADIENIAKLEAEVFSDAWTAQSIAETFSQKQTFLVVAEVDGVVEGYCIIYYVLDEAEIARIAVSENVRRLGLGRGILDTVSKWCVENQIEKLLLDVRESNVGAIAFYKGYGFEEDGLRKNFYEMPKEHAVLMSKCIIQRFPLGTL